MSLDLTVHEQQIRELREKLNVEWNEDFSHYMMNLLQGYSFTAQWFDGTITPLDINVQKNILVVSVSGRKEKWDLTHTLVGFNRGDYTISSTL